MKQLSQVKEEMAELLKFKVNKADLKAGLSEKQIARAIKARTGKVKKRLQYLKNIRLYLEKEPREEFVKKEIERLDSSIKNIDKDYTAWLDSLEDSTDTPFNKKVYDKQTGYLTLKKKHLAHLKTLRDVLD